MAYTTIDKPDEYFNTKLYTGNGSATHAITGVGFQPDFVWIKDRVEVYDHHLFDAVRGGGNSLYSNDSVAENTYTTDISFTSDGFTTAGVGSGAINYINQNTHTFASWNWKANGAGVSNTQGSIASTVSANTTSGFSIVSWTTPASGNFTVGHGLGVTPSMVIIKVTTQTGDWWVYHKGLGVNTTDYLSLNQTIAESSLTSMWGSTGMTSTLCGFGAGISAYSNNPMIAYCFAEVKGFSKFGSYTGNGSTDGTFIYTGFKPAFVMMKNASQSGKWLMMDNKRPTSGGNPNNARLFADVGNVESTASNMIDILSNGFKLRTSDTDHNASGDINIYMAFAENPFVTSTSVPTTAR
jgi:hypothetical protein